MQLELFSNEPFSVRLTIEDAMRIFWDTYWHRLPSAPASRMHKIRACKFFKGKFIDAISKIDVENYKEDLKSQGLSDPTVNRHLSTLCRMFTRLAEYKEAKQAHGHDFTKVQIPRKDQNPCLGIRKVSEIPRSRRVVLNPHEFKVLKQYADEDLKDILNALIWTRLRPSDIKRITSHNINWHTRQIEGIQNKTITTRNPSGVPYFVPMVGPLEELIKRRSKAVKPGSPLFPWRNMQKRWERARKHAGLFLVQLRDLRRTGATNLLDNGEDFVTVSKGLGHTTTRMTDRYVPRRKSHLESSVKRLVETF